MDKAVMDNLRDAGFSKEEAGRYEELDDEGRLRLLATHRRTILDRVHEEEQKICRIDYLVHKIEKNGGLR